MSAPMSRHNRTAIEKWLDNHGSIVKAVCPPPIPGGRMSRRVPISTALSAFGPSAIRALWLALALTATPYAADAGDKLVLQLHRAAQFEFAGYYAALWQGFYREAGLEVEINPGAPPGAPPIDPVREIVESRAQFGTGTVQLLIRAAEGQSLRLLAPIFQQSDARIYYRASGDFSSPGRCSMAGSDGCPRAMFSISSCAPRSMPKGSIRTSCDRCQPSRAKRSPIWPVIGSTRPSARPGNCRGRHESAASR